MHGLEVFQLDLRVELGRLYDNIHGYVPGPCSPVCTPATLVAASGPLGLSRTSFAIWLSARLQSCWLRPQVPSIARHEANHPALELEVGPGVGQLNGAGSGNLDRDFAPLRERPCTSLLVFPGQSGWVLVVSSLLLRVIIRVIVNGRKCRIRCSLSDEFAPRYRCSA